MFRPLTMNHTSGDDFNPLFQYLSLSTDELPGLDRTPTGARSRLPGIVALFFSLERIYIYKPLGITIRGEANYVASRAFLEAANPLVSTSKMTPAVSKIVLLGGFSGGRR